MTSLWRAGRPAITTDPFPEGGKFDHVVVGAGLTGRNLRPVFQAYVDSQRAAFDWMVDYLEAGGVPFDRRPSVTWAESPDQLGTLMREYAAAREAGLPVRWEDRAALPAPGVGAIVLEDQVQFDPMEVLARLAADLRALGGVIVEGARVRRVAFGETTTVHSVRWHRGTLLVGGEGHGVGRQDEGADPYGELEHWAQERWPGAEPTHRWSAQDYAPFSGIPFVGWMPRTRRRVYFATGYEKWGMTGAVAAALLLEADLAGRREGWQRVLGMRPTLPQTVGVGLGASAAVLAWYARGYAEAVTRAVRARRDDEDARLLPTATIASEHGSTEVCLVCPHAGAIVRWNAAESTWDCPAHGSRFEATGRLIEGPAIDDLRTRSRAPKTGLGRVRETGVTSSSPAS